MHSGLLKKKEKKEKKEKRKKGPWFLLLLFVFSFFKTS
jgi:hypothetical protein